MLYFATHWYWVLVAMLFLGLNQGLSWSMALNSKLDLAKSTQRGLVNGLNEFSGYAAVGIAGFLSASLANWLGAREALFLFALSVMLLGLLLAFFQVKETKSWADAHALKGLNNSSLVPVVPDLPKRSFASLLNYASVQNKSLVALNQAGLVEKFVDALVWVLLPVYLLAQEVSLMVASAIITVYGVFGALRN